MTRNSTTQFVTAVKLRELRAQRGQLRDAYDRLAAAVAATPDPRERLRALYSGLKDLTLAGKLVHPELADLGILADESPAAATSSQELLESWYRRLAAELAAGRLRSEYVFRFGALLEQWATGNGGAHPQPDPARVRELRAKILRPAQPNDHRALIEELLAGISGGQLSEATNPGVSGEELWPVLHTLAADPYQPARLRAEAKRFENDTTLAGELADAITLLGSGPEALRWPDQGVATRAMWTRNKWRLYPEQDLPTTCLTDLLADRWAPGLCALIGGGNRERLDDLQYRVQRLRNLNAPQVLISHERKRLMEAEAEHAATGRFLSIAEPGDIFDPHCGHSGDSAADDLYRPHEDSVLAQRRQQLVKLHQVTASSYYGTGQSAFMPVAALVNAEIRLARAAFGDRPLYLVKLDLRDYYPSIPHDLVLTILRTIGAPAENVSFVARFLAMPIAAAPAGADAAAAADAAGAEADGPGQTGDPGVGTARVATRGVPMGYRLSALLAELVGRCLEGYVQQRTPVRIIRLVDDICLLTPDPEAAVAALGHVKAFCEACGLSLNDDKAGAVCIGGQLPAALAAPLPRWGMLTLDEQGEWSVHEPTFQQYLAASRRHTAAADSVLSKVDIINADLVHLTYALAIGTDLGSKHRGTASLALNRFAQDYFGPGHSIAAALCDEIVALVGMPEGAGQGNAEAVSAVPEAWLYWPITAGGLGLRNPQVMAGQYAEAFRRKTRVAVPQAPVEPGWNTRDNHWASYYRDLLEPLEPAAPRETVATKSLVQDFISRGTTISHGAQSSLTPYWCWILSIYGPEIRERFGTFRFLNTELVPLCLLGSRRLDDRSGGDDRFGGEPPF